MLGLGVGLGFNRVIGAPLLLDKFTGAAAAYSLRALSSTTTDVVRVRRSSDNAEQDFSPDEINDSSLATWVGAGNDGFVTTWYDQSGNSNDATQATAASQPKIVDAGVLVTENGRPALDFDGTDDFLATAVVPNILDHPFTVFATVKDDTNVSNMYYFNTVSGSSAIIGQSTSQFLAFMGASLEGGTVSNSQRIQTLLANTTNSEMWVNESSVASGDVGVRDVSGIEISAGIFNWDGKIQEIIAYDTNESSNRTNIETNINNYYSIY